MINRRDNVRARRHLTSAIQHSAGLARPGFPSSHEATMAVGSIKFASEYSGVQDTDIFLFLPSRGQKESPTATSLPSYDAECYLCPGNARAQGDRNPQYENTFVFVNDFSAVKEEQASYEPEANDKSASYP